MLILLGFVVSSYLCQHLFCWILLSIAGYRNSKINKVFASQSTKPHELMLQTFLVKYGTIL